MTKAIILIIALGLVALLPSKLIADDSVKWSNDPLPKEMTTLEMIKYYSGKYGSDPSEVYSVGMCESGLRNNVVGDNGHSFGAFAYFKSTWDRYVKIYNERFGLSEKLDINSIHDQIKLTAFVFSLEEVNKKEWTTYVAITKGGTYSFYSSFHKKDFTISCKYNKI